MNNIVLAIPIENLGQYLAQTRAPRDQYFYKRGGYGSRKRRQQQRARTGAGKPRSSSDDNTRSTAASENSECPDQKKEKQAKDTNPRKEAVVPRIKPTAKFKPWQPGTSGKSGQKSQFNYKDKAKFTWRNRAQSDPVAGSSHTIIEKVSDAVSDTPYNPPIVYAADLAEIFGLDLIVSLAVSLPTPPKR